MLEKLGASIPAAILAVRSLLYSLRETKALSSLRPAAGSKALFRCLPIALLISTGMLGCKRVQPIVLIGAWTITDESRTVLPPELQKASGRIALHSDGTFAAFEMPGFLYIPGRDAARLDTGSGTWELVSREGKQQLQLYFTAIEAWRDGLPYDTQLEVSTGRLYYFFGGDADEGRRVEFERKRTRP